MANDTVSIENELTNIDADVRSSFGTMTAEQLNWKPAAESWSVAQCLEHLILSNKEMEPAVDAKIAGAKNTFWENYSPFTGFIGGFMIKSLKNDSRKFKAPAKSIVPPSDVPADIVDQFSASQKEIIERMKSLAPLDWNQTVVTSPFMKIMTYTVKDGMDILIEHEKRHVRQAKRVVETEGFPK